MRKQDLHPRTALLNQKEKNACKRSRLNALAWMAKTFPEAFDNQRRIRPLKIGIAADLLRHADAAAEQGISKSKLREALVVFTRRIDYLTCLKTKEMRVDLEGNPSTAVSEEEAANAAGKIRKRIEKCARNARKNLEGKTPSHYQKPHRENRNTPPTMPFNGDCASAQQSGYPERAPAFGAHQQHTPTPQRIDSVVVKRKAAKAHDPDAVARLKAKLGLKQPL